MDELLPFLLPAALVVAAWAIILGRAYGRARMLPICWRCGAWKVVKSHIFNHFDLIPMLSCMVPVRCGGCYHRSYVLRGVVPQKDMQRPAWQLENRSLRYVDESSTTLAMIYQAFPPPPQPPMVSQAPFVRGKLPRTLPAPPTAPPTTADEHAKQLTNLLEAIVATADSAPALPVPQPAPIHRGRRRRRRPETAQAV